MSCPAPDEGQSIKNLNHPHRRKKKKFARTDQFPVSKKDRKKSKFASNMSSWAESFTVAATWQLKHQLAFWKARATALDYENKVLHEIIRKNNFQTTIDMNRSDSEVDELTEGTEDPPDANGDDFEVSEEFIEFLRTNAKYKEDARLERERLKAKMLAEEASVEDLEAGPSKQPDVEGHLKELYGAKWQRIAALETSLQSSFINETDNTRPSYWPNIPFNFNYS